jgi:hypothetical protein
MNMKKIIYLLFFVLVFNAVQASKFDTLYLKNSDTSFVEIEKLECNFHRKSIGVTAYISVHQNIKDFILYKMGEDSSFFELKKYTNYDSYDKTIILYFQDIHIKSHNIYKLSYINNVGEEVFLAQNKIVFQTNFYDNILDITDLNGLSISGKYVGKAYVVFESGKREVVFFND